MNAADLIRASEGRRNAVYDDATGLPVPLGGECKGTLTIGVGHCSPYLKPGDVWTDDQIEGALAADMAEAEMEAVRVLGPITWDSLDEARKAVIVDMVFNLGQTGFAKFIHAIAAIRAGEYERAATLMLASKWAGQVGHRASRDAEIMRSGNFPDKA